MPDNAIEFAHTWIVESLSNSQQLYVEQVSRKISHITITYPDVPLSEPMIVALAQSRQPLWIIVHSEPIQEIIELLEYAIEIAHIEHVDPEIWVIAPNFPQQKYHFVRWFDWYPCYQIFQYVDRIFTGCGFNSMRQTENFAHKRMFVPFQRTFDDQFRRASLCKSVQKNTNTTKQP